MGDLLIRNLDDDVERRLRDQAQSNGRSLSEEARLRLQRSLTAETSKERKSAGEVFRAIIESSNAHWTEEELAAIEAVRHGPDREPPRFDE